MGEYGTAENPYIIRIPRWDDVIKIHPRLQWWDDPVVAKADWSEFYQRRNKGTLDQWGDQSKRKEIQRRVDYYQAMAASPTPEIVKAIGAGMTFMDDVQDLLSTALVLSRPLWKRAISSSPLVGLKLVPWLGALLTINDLLNLFQALWMSLSCGSVGKKRAWGIVSPLNIGKFARIYRVSKFLDGKPGITDLIQGLQATDTLFGTGLQLGSLMGLVTDSFWGRVKAAGGAKVQIQHGVSKSALSDYDRAATGMDHAVRFLSGIKQPSRNNHMTALVAYHLGLQVIAPILNDPVKIQRSNEGLDWQVPQIMPWEPMTRVILQEHGIDPDREEPHMLPGSPNNITYRELAEYLPKANIIPSLVSMFPNGEDGVFLATEISEIAMDTYNADLPITDWETYEPTQELTNLEKVIQGAFEVK